MLLRSFTVQALHQHSIVQVLHHNIIITWFLGISSVFWVYFFSRAERKLWRRDNSNGHFLHPYWHDNVLYSGTVLHQTGLDWTGLDRTGLYSTVQYHRTRKLPNLFFFPFFLFFPSPQTPILAILYHTQSATLLSFIPIYSILFFSSSPSSPFHSHQSASQPASQQTGYASYVDKQTASKQASKQASNLPLLTNYCLPSLSSPPPPPLWFTFLSSLFPNCFA